MTGDFYECPKCGWRARLADVDTRTRCTCGRMVQLPERPAPDPRAWRVAIALAYECRLDWARWASGETGPHPILDGARGMTIPHWPTPVPAPWDVPAYLADCARRKVEPGPLPSLEYDDGRVRWKVFGVGRQLVVELRVGKFRGSVWSDGDMFVSTADESPASVHDHPDFSRLVTAAAKAMP